MNRNSNVDKHPILVKYRDTMSRLIKSLYPYMDIEDILDAVEYSINKRYTSHKAVESNAYLQFEPRNVTLLGITDYIARRHPIITSYGVLFERHETLPNPMANVIQSFLNLRKAHKKEMFKYPKGSEQFEYYNLLQGLDKVDTNG